MFDRRIIFIALVIQAVCAFFFISDILSAHIGFRAEPISWRLREIIEISAAFGLVLGFVLGAVALYRAQQRHRQAEAKLRAASGAFMEMVEDAFDDWGLTPAERDVALFSIKGFSVPEIAALRSTSEGTVKAQTNAIYRKAGVNGRSQLLGHFIEGLVEVAPTPAPVPVPVDTAPQAADKVG